MAVKAEIAAFRDGKSTPAGPEFPALKRLQRPLMIAQIENLQLTPYAGQQTGQGLAKYFPLTKEQKSRSDASGGNWAVSFEEEHYLESAIQDLTHCNFLVKILMVQFVTHVL